MKRLIEFFAAEKSLVNGLIEFFAGLSDSGHRLDAVHSWLQRIVSSGESQDPLEGRAHAVADCKALI